MVKTLQRLFFKLRNAFRGERKPRHDRPADARVDADPWLAGLLDNLGDRYRLAEGDGPDGIQLLRRTGKARFNPMRVYLRPTDRGVCGDYDVRVHDGALDAGRALLDRKVTGRLDPLGLKMAKETVEEWGGHVITRRYEGRCSEARIAAEAIRFMCEQSEQVMDTSLE